MSEEKMQCSLEKENRRVVDEFVIYDIPVQL
jgi:hypothetical protein